MTNLVIVESPAKAKTIKKYLGKDFSVVASMGHVRDLPKLRLGVKIKENFAPDYANISEKKDLIKKLKELAKTSDMIYLATDPDREGEAISWHLATILKLDLESENRVTFNEITKTGIDQGMKSPRKIDLDLVNAQQARRILDRLVGYKLSPFLSQKIRRGLSAGRVQSVALKIIVDREREIQAFVPEEYWTIDAKFLSKDGLTFDSNFYGVDGKKIKIMSGEQAKEIVDGIDKKSLTISEVKVKDKRLSPPPPFITSTLQQDASRKLGFQAKKTMSIAQQLYEGVEVTGYGAVGLITYMRTDSLRVSEEAIAEGREYISEAYGKKYLPAKNRYYRTKKNAQDAHEAIRPTMPKVRPDDIKNDLSVEQYKLYKLIWSRFIASQTANCVHETTQATITDGKYMFRSSGFRVKFDGFTIVYTEGTDDKEKKSKQLPKLEQDDPVKVKSFSPKQHFTEPPPKYTEASLIKRLEEDGIGRPSTYASVISTLTTRKYVTREAKRFTPTELGEVITDLMSEKFKKIVDIKFTAKMENDLDTVEKGEVVWTKILEDFYSDFEKTLKKAKEDMKDKKIILKEDQTDIVCEKCGRKMIIKTGRYGRFIACPGYPECDNVKKLINKIGVKCPKCGSDLIERTTKKGRVFYGCEGYPNCDFASWQKPTDEKCPQCGEMLYEKKGKKPKLFCKKEGCGFEKVKDEKNK